MCKCLDQYDTVTVGLNGLTDCITRLCQAPNGMNRHEDNTKCGN